ncbi:hypothetical protein QCF01_15600, partial [Staphylococcus aureus]|nr:hypothetical protein [Staphylococcus aureus]
MRLVERGRHRLAKGRGIDAQDEAANMISRHPEQRRGERIGDEGRQRGDRNIGAERQREQRRAEDLRDR